MPPVQAAHYFEQWDWSLRPVDQTQTTQLGRAILAMHVTEEYVCLNIICLCYDILLKDLQL